jgi:hypothetical protein
MTVSGDIPRIKYNKALRRAWLAVAQDEEIKKENHRLYEPYFQAFISRLQAAQRAEPALDPMAWEKIDSLALITTDVRLFAYK